MGILFLTENFATKSTMYLSSARLFSIFEHINTMLSFIFSSSVFSRLTAVCAGIFTKISGGFTPNASKIPLNIFIISFENGVYFLRVIPLIISNIILLASYIDLHNPKFGAGSVAFA